MQYLHLNYKFSLLDTDDHFVQTDSLDQTDL